MRSSARTMRYSDDTVQRGAGFDAGGLGIAARTSGRGIPDQAPRGESRDAGVIGEHRTADHLGVSGSAGSAVAGAASGIAPAPGPNRWWSSASGSIHS